MSTTVPRPAASSPLTRPGLALLLAILSVPGSTLVWDLPLPVPGFWIGLPLGIAAIVLARRAREADGPSAMTTVALALAGLAIGQMGVVTIVSAVS